MLVPIPRKIDNQKANKFEPKHPNKPSFCPVIDKNLTKKSLVNKFFKFLFLFSDFWLVQIRFPENFYTLSPESPKNPKVKKSKICFVQIFCFIFYRKIVKNGFVLEWEMGNEIE